MITAEDFKALEGKIVKVTYKYFYGGLASRTGRLELDGLGWAYVYDDDKSGRNYNGAFHLIERRLKKVVRIEIVEKNGEQT